VRHLNKNLKKFFLQSSDTFQVGKEQQRLAFFLNFMDILLNISCWQARPNQECYRLFRSWNVVSTVQVFANCLQNNIWFITALFGKICYWVWRNGATSRKFGRGKSFDFKRATVFCKQINAFFSGDYFYCLADVSPTYSNTFPHGKVFNHVSCNLPITKKQWAAWRTKTKSAKPTNRTSRYRKWVTVCGSERGR